ncbi:LPXTG cell wall anchor domain-containing protein [Brevibacterium antiquum]|uniref:LPXTG-motif cell wall anchor domain-containing protein n=1 Tax=Brevibacterium antiquum TaxID=234835 RepID=A0A2H1IW20_9MICO|nr:LPXTG cell wall anchor domain-containing protein [Brevibacterium antiquum]SMX79409.1 LPXTG-motif cell wall anchor domain-containing protein [Brevibacterium antiquum]
MQKKLVQSSLALTAAAALGLGSAFVASPALADGPQKLDVQNETQVQKALSKVEGINAYGESNGKLHIGAEKESDALEKLADDYENVEVRYGVKELKPHAGNDLVGGAGYLVQSGESGGACSTGFSGWDGDDNPIVVTAGHCAKIINKNTGVFEGKTTVNETEQPSTAPAHGGNGFIQSGNGVIGTWGFNNFGGDLVVDEDQTPADDDIDFAIINVDESKYNVKTGVTDWTTAGIDDLSSKLATDISKVGPHTDGAVSKSGRTTGLTHSEVWSSFNEQYEFVNIGGRFVHGFGVESSEADPFSAPGDSGGAVFQGDTAVGVISGGGTATDAADIDHEFVWVADLDYSLATAGKTLSFEDPADAPEAPAAPTVDDQIIEPKGDVTGKTVANADVKISWTGAADGEATVKADAGGKFSVEGPSAEGSYDAKAVATVDGQSSEAAAFNLTVKAADDANAEADADGGDSDAGADADGAGASADAKDAESNADSDGSKDGEAPAERKISISPKEVAASDFVKKDKGVTITVKGFDEGENVSLEVVAGPENVEGITLDETANEDGVAAFSIYGTNASDPSAYLGKYDVQVTGDNDTDDEKALAGSFSVVADEDGNGGGSDDGDGGGSDLPRTGAELTGLAAGAGLLVVGGAAVVLTTRRNKKN